MALNTLPNAGLTNRGYPSDRLVTPIIINGDMSVAQRGTSSTGITGDGYFTVDRFKNEMSSAGTWTQSQSTDVPSGQGFSSSVKYDCTTANASLSAGTYGFITQRFEGQNLQMLKFGTSSAETLTLSFWVKSNKTGTYITEIITFATTKSQSQSYTISSANTWEKKTLTFTGDTATAIANSNARSLNLVFWLVAGTNNTSGTLNTSFNSTVQANRAVGQVNLADSTSNEWYVTGVQLEVGTSASDFEFLPVDVNLTRCQRYLQRFGNTNRQGICVGTLQPTSNLHCSMTYVTTMRASPSQSFSNLQMTDRYSADYTVSSIGNFIAATDCCYVRFSTSTDAPHENRACYNIVVTGGSDGFFQLDAEL